MTRGEYNELKQHFYKQFDKVLIQERSDLYKILELIDRLAAAESEVSNAGWARDADQWGR